MFRSCAGLVALSSLLLSGAALAQEKIKVGVTATLEGTYTVLGEDGIRGHQTALNTLGKKIGDKELEFISLLREVGPADDSHTRDYHTLTTREEVASYIAAIPPEAKAAGKVPSRQIREWMTLFNHAACGPRAPYKCANTKSGGIFIGLFGWCELLLPTRHIHLYAQSYYTTNGVWGIGRCFASTDSPRLYLPHTLDASPALVL